MTKKFIKFIERSPHKDRLLKVLEDIAHDNLSQYDLKPLVNMDNHFRIRIGTIRIIFIRTSQGNKIVEVNNRGDIY